MNIHNGNEINNNKKKNAKIYYTFTNKELETILFCLKMIEKMMNELQDTNFQNITTENIKNLISKLANMQNIMGRLKRNRKSMYLIFT